MSDSIMSNHDITYHVKSCHVIFIYSVKKVSSDFISQHIISNRVTYPPYTFLSFNIVYQQDYLYMSQYTVVFLPRATIRLYCTTLHTVLYQINPIGHNFKKKMILCYFIECIIYWPCYITFW